MTNPTKHEWKLDGTSVYAMNNDGINAWFTSQIGCSLDTSTDEERLAVARLMHAAPQLLDAAKAALQYVESRAGNSLGDLIVTGLLRKAIRAAEGGEE